MCCHMLNKIFIFVTQPLANLVNTMMSTPISVLPVLSTHINLRNGKHIVYHAVIVTEPIILEQSTDPNVYVSELTLLICLVQHALFSPVWIDSSN